MTLDAAGLIGDPVAGATVDSINFINNFGPIHPGLAQQLTKPTGEQELLPTYVTPVNAILGTESLTPINEVLVWFEDNTETSIMFSVARPNSVEVDLTSTNTQTRLFSNGEWTTPEP